MKRSTAIAALLLALSGRGAPAQTWSVEVARELPGNPVTLRRWDPAGAVEYPFPPADRFDRNHAPAVAAAPDGTVWVVWAAEQ
nr:hypothetical protein [bacterium]